MPPRTWSTAADRGAARRWRTLAKAPRSFADIAARHRAAVAELSTDASGGAGRVRGLRRRRAGGGVRRDRARSDQRGLRARRLRLCRAVPRRRSATASVRRPEQRGVRVRIYGPLEARLQHVDRVVLGGLVEGIWPPETRTDPWLSRPMRHALGLDLPERRIGLSAHDFAQALGAREVILSIRPSSRRADGASRFVQRLAAVAGEERWTGGARARRALSRLARALDQPGSGRKRDRAAGAEAAARGAADRAVGDRDRGLAARSLHDLCQARAAAAPLDAIDTPPGAPIAAPHPRRDRRLHRRASRRGCRTIPRPR